MSISSISAIDTVHLQLIQYFVKQGADRSFCFTYLFSSEIVICDLLPDLVPFLQFEKHDNPHRGVIL